MRYLVCIWNKNSGGGGMPPDPPPLFYKNGRIKVHIILERTSPIIILGMGLVCTATMSSSCYRIVSID